MYIHALVILHLPSPSPSSPLPLSSPPLPSPILSLLLHMLPTPRSGYQNLMELLWCDSSLFCPGGGRWSKIQPESLVLTVQMIARRSEPGAVCIQVSVCEGTHSADSTCARVCVCVCVSGGGGGGGGILVCGSTHEEQRCFSQWVTYNFFYPPPPPPPKKKKPCVHH